MSKNFRMPDGGTVRTRSARSALREWSPRHVGGHSSAAYPTAGAVAVATRSPVNRAARSSVRDRMSVITPLRRGSAAERRVSSIRPAISRISASRMPRCETAVVPEPEAARAIGGPFLERDHVAVRKDARLLERDLGDVAGQPAPAEIQQDHVVVRAAAHDPVAPGRQLVREDLRIRDDRRLRGAKRGRRRDPEADGLRGDPPEVRRALGAGEDRPVDLLREVGPGEDHAAVRPEHRLVGRERDGVGVGHRARRAAPRRRARRYAPCPRGAAPRPRARSSPKRRVVDRPRVRAPAGDDQPRPMPASEVANLVEVDRLGVAADAVVLEPVDRAGDRRPIAVREVAAVVEPEREHGVAGLQDRAIHGEVRVDARARLDVRVVRAEERLHAIDRQLLDLVRVARPAVVAATRVALGRLRREDRAERFEHRRRRLALGRDQVDRRRAALGLGRDELRDRRVDLGE